MERWRWCRCPSGMPRQLIMGRRYVRTLRFVNYIVENICDWFPGSVYRGPLGQRCY